VVNPLPIHTTGMSQDRYLRAIFQPLIDDRKVQVDNYFTDDSALVAAETFMLLHPDQHVAVVLETWSEDPGKIREIYFESGRRRLERSSRSDDQWYIALAVPNLKAWALTDDRIQQRYERIRQDPATASTPEERAKIDQANYRVLASKIGEWTADHPFGLEKLKQKSRQVRELCAFIDKSLNPEPKPVLATAADWF
jgi:hypothetical protein